MKTLATLMCIFVGVFCSIAMGTTTKAKLQVAPDGFPRGQDTPEGAACDLARAYIKRDVALFTNTCVRLYSSGSKGPVEYIAFLRKTAAGMQSDDKTQPSPISPRSIENVFAARHLSMHLPAAIGRSNYGFEDIMYVDVAVLRQDGGHAVNRTMVIKDRDKKWYVHPIPGVTAGLSAGLNDEPQSTQQFWEVYDIQK